MISFSGQLMRHPLIKLFRLSNLIPVPKDHSGQPLEVDNNQLRAIIKVDPLTTTQEVANINHSMIIRHLKQIRKVKKLDKWVPHELSENLFLNYHFEVLSSLILCNNNEPFPDRIVTRDEKWIL